VSWRDFTPPEWLPADEKALAQLRERGACEPYEKEYLRRDGTRVPVLLTDVIMPGGTGEFLGFVVNMTVRKQAEETLRSSRSAALNVMEDAVAARLQAEKTSADLARFNRAAVGRELRMIELKKLINELSAELGRPPRYDLDFEKEQA
jgi:hypothetical protein